MDVADGSGRTALHLAGEWGQCQPCPAHVPIGGSAQPLSLSAAASGCISCSEILCDFKAPLNSKDKVRSLCSWSCYARLGLSCNAAQRGVGHGNWADIRSRVPRGGI